MDTQEHFNQVIEDLTHNPMYMDVCKIYTKDKEISEELYQELFIILIEYDKTKIIEMNDNGQLKYFIIGIIKRMATSKTTAFYRKIIKFTYLTDTLPDILIDVNNKLVDDGTELEEKLIDDGIFESKLELMGNIQHLLSERVKREPKFHYQRTLFNMCYLEKMNYREIHEDTKIPPSSVYKTIRTTLRWVMGELDEDINTIKKLT